jgi:hypothetical protein
MIQQQLSFPFSRLVPLPQPFPFPLQKQDNKRMIQIMELHPLSLHPQFVAAKSLISDLQNIYIYSILYETIFPAFRFFVKSNDFYKFIRHY